MKDYPELVQDLTETQGIGQTIIGDSIEDSGCHLCQSYGNRRFCEDFDDAICSNDGILWHSGDFGAPYICTAHMFPPEKFGYEFVEMN